MSATRTGAVEFSTTKLGFEFRSDEPMGPPGSPRWIEVAPPRAEDPSYQ
jgi:hypothetical protein